MLSKKLTKPPQTTPTYIEDVFSTYLYTGNGTTQTITNGIDLSTKGGLTWIKDRTNSLTDNNLQDTVRGAGRSIYSDLTIAQEYFAGYGITSFNTNGFTLGLDNYTNTNAHNYASWTFRKQPKFFDVVTYTGNGANRTIAHNLGSVPGCIIIKKTSAVSDWYVYHQSNVSPASGYELLNTTDARLNSTTIWNNTSPTSSVFSLGSSSSANNNGATYVAYLWASDAGGFGLTGTDSVINCGSFSSASEIYLGWEPQWIMYKKVGAAGTDWKVSDNMRGWSRTSYNDLFPNLSNAEQTHTATDFYPTATGFTPAFNGAAAFYIFVAIRRGPMKVPTDGTKVFKPIAFTGDGTTDRFIDAGFSPDMVIHRNRPSTQENYLFDRLAMGNGTSLQTDSTAAQYTEANPYWKFNSFQNGIAFSPGGGYNPASAYFNGTGTSNIHYDFRRAPSFFDEVCYTSAAGSINHNLGAAPELVIYKPRSAGTWYVCAAPNGFGELNSTAAWAGAGNGSGLGPNLANATATTIHAGANLYGSGTSMVTYLFATCAGVSKVGSYTGNGSSQTINCGFTGGVRFVLIKRTDSTGDWYVYDTARGMTTLTDPYLLLNSTAVESATLGSVTTVTTGFAVNASILAAINTNGASYLFFAVA